MKETLTQEYLKSILSYNPETGIFIRKVRTSNCINVGDFAGTKTAKGYLEIGINGKYYLAHRLAWLYIHGYFPENDIDHINNYRNDNRLCNLREVSKQCNRRNSKIQYNNTSGISGVSYYKPYSKWVVRITVNNKRYNLGYFDNYTEAVCHRLAVEQCLDWDGCDSNSSAYQYVKKYVIDKENE